MKKKKAGSAIGKLMEGPTGATLALMDSELYFREKKKKRKKK